MTLTTKLLMTRISWNAGPLQLSAELLKCLMYNDWLHSVTHPAWVAVVPAAEHSSYMQRAELYCQNNVTFTVWQWTTADCQWMKITKRYSTSSTVQYLQRCPGYLFLRNVIKTCIFFEVRCILFKSNRVRYFWVVYRLQNATCPR